ncbi:HDOD domain-containing protein [Planctomicrobium sp. SH668]|uniref:HDOD domain-containing protein n=1 Tax=Planctomicrobium sp. SH668 TaxID=3448126 RepID=UPI003F5AF3DF
METLRHNGHAPTRPHFSPRPPLDDLHAMLEIVQEDDVDFYRLAAVMERSPLLSTTIIRAANSVEHGSTRQVKTMRHALILIGLVRIRAILQNLLPTAVKTEQASNPTESFS